MTSRLFVWFLIAFRLHSKIPIVRDRLSEDHQRCEIVRAFFGICDSSTGHPNIQCSGLIMSQFKVEKGRISRYISSFLHPTSKLIAFARQGRVLFWFQAIWRNFSGSLFGYFIQQLPK